ncbi:hypothetical protein [Sphingobacterium lumbrici]|uniref:hypothetical protein n=1 Tax=Sphingobacterium lumbrici TaxID=2559600 RepID=UPI00112AF5AB|nr:hypothetical protein [Sphingobacterium lumbrici]
MASSAAYSSKSAKVVFFNSDEEYSCTTNALSPHSRKMSPVKLLAMAKGGTILTAKRSKRQRKFA